MTSSPAKRKLIFIAGGIVLVAALVGAFVWLSNDSNSKDKAAADSSQQVAGQTASASDSPRPAPDSAGGTSGQPASPQPSGAANSQTGSLVTIANHSFSPANLTVKKGAKVTWTNKDSATHALDPAEDAALGPHSPQLTSGASFTYTYTQAGTFKYICVLHPDMAGTVTVTE